MVIKHFINITLVTVLGVLLSSCKNDYPLGKINDGAETMRTCLSTFDSGHEKAILNCSCDNLKHEDIFHIRKMLNKRHDNEIIILDPHPLLNQKKAQAIKLNAGGIIIGMSFINKSWCIRSAFWK